MVFTTEGTSVRGAVAPALQVLVQLAQLCKGSRAPPVPQVGPPHWHRSQVSRVAKSAAENEEVRDVTTLAVNQAIMDNRCMLHIVVTIDEDAHAKVMRRHRFATEQGQSTSPCEREWGSLQVERHPLSGTRPGRRYLDRHMTANRD